MKTMFPKYAASGNLYKMLFVDLRFFLISF